MIKSASKLFLNISVLLVLLTLNISSNANATVVKSMRFWQSPDSTRVVFDLSEQVKYEVQVLESPDRLVVDILDGTVAVDLKQLEIKSDLVKSVRESQSPRDGILRLVLDLAKPASPKSFALKPYQDYGDRLVIDLTDKKAEAEQEKVVPVQPSGQRDIVIAIDAGHGGEDPGAIGPTGMREKHVTLDLAKELAKALNKESGVKAILTRETDFYLPLRKRTDIARKHRADLFVSVHADSFTSPKARGASVWVLSTGGAKSELARWLRKQETESELLGGVDNTLDLSSYEKPVAQVILDLQMEHSIQASMTLGREVHRKMAKVAPKMHKKHVEENSFIVLKNPDIPSILVESGFLSNPQEEALLKTSKYRTKLAKAVSEGIIDYLESHAPDGTLMAAKFRKNIYHVQRGDSLTKVARRFNVSIRDIKNANNMSTNTVRIGQKLIIPTAN